MKHPCQSPNYLRKGRGADSNPANRFERLAYTPDPEAYDPEAPAPATELFRDATRSLLTHNDSPDLPFEYSLNPYRGCEHGCECWQLSDGLASSLPILIRYAHVRKRVQSTAHRRNFLSATIIVKAHRAAISWG